MDGVIVYTAEQIHGRPDMCEKYSSKYRTSGLWLIIGLSALVVFGFVLSCNDDSPVKPFEPRDYAVYFSDSHADQMYFEYHPTTGRLDSFHLDLPQT